jgi:hypothetical protein
MAREAGAVGAEPALQVSPFHSADARTITVGSRASAPRGGVDELSAYSAEFRKQLAKLSNACLHAERDAFGQRRFVREVVEGIHDVDPSLVPCGALGYRSRVLDDLGGHPTTVVLRVADRQARRLGRVGLR